MIEDGSESVAGDAAILHSCDGEVFHAMAKFSRHFAMSLDRLGLEDVRAFRVHLVSNGIVAGAEPDGARVAVFLWRDPWPRRDPGTDCLCPLAPHAADGAERR